MFYVKCIKLGNVAHNSFSKVNNKRKTKCHAEGKGILSCVLRQNGHFNDLLKYKMS